MDQVNVDRFAWARHTRLLAELAADDYADEDVTRLVGVIAAQSVAIESRRALAAELACSQSDLVRLALADVCVSIASDGDEFSREVMSLLRDDTDPYIRSDLKLASSVVGRTLTQA